MSINWNTLRPWDGSQNTAFEELVCQLARHEEVADRTLFRRKGTPDGGVECYWALSGGEEWAWQAKFFPSGVTPPQWGQIDESVRTALEKHPRITRYFVCLPLDRPDPRKVAKSGERERWLMNHWDEHVAKWEGWAREHSMDVVFEFWGESEIADRLARSRHQGRTKFWFDDEFLSDQWFWDRFAEAKADADERYTPEVNVNLPVARLFDGLSCSSRFRERLRQRTLPLKKAYSNVAGRRAAVGWENSPKAGRLKSHMDVLFLLLTDFNDPDVLPMNASPLRKSIQDAAVAAWDYAKALALDFESQDQADTDTGSADALRQQKYDRRNLQNLSDELTSLDEFLASDEATLAQTPTLFLSSDAGKGKTHLFCDVTRRCVEEGFPALLLLGQWFGDSDPWQQILNRAGLDCTKDEFLGALEAAAEARGGRALLLIDAINEGDGQHLWPKNMAGFLALLRRYPRIGVAFSVRSSYWPAIVPNGVATSTEIVYAIHPGFSGREYEAMRAYFTYFGIAPPSFPILTPEFSTPLFLKVFCQALHDTGRTDFPEQSRGITRVFDVLFDAVNTKLSRPDFLDYDRRDDPVRVALDTIAQGMTEVGQEWLPYREARDMVNAVLPSTGGHETTLFRRLNVEGLLTVGHFYNPVLGKVVEGVAFTYQRLSDHLIVRHLLDKHLAPGADLGGMFAPGSPVGDLTRDELACEQHPNLVEALCVQVPERTGHELPDLLPHVADTYVMAGSFARSLVWRDPDSITDATTAYVHRNVFNWDDTLRPLFDALLTLSPDPNHPYNAWFLHDLLEPMPLAERDYLWTINIHSLYDRDHRKGTAVERLIDWAMSVMSEDGYSDDAASLSATALAWLLTASNRFLRDRATKALVNILGERFHLTLPLMEQFRGVNDLYVRERLFAAAYGGAVRSRNRREVGRVARAVFEWEFADGCPTPHILLRDYARGLVEYAAHLGCDLSGVDLAKVRPPYRSKWPSQFPTHAQVAEIQKKQAHNNADGPYVATPYASLTDYSDFARYVIGTNSAGRGPWTNVPLTQRYPLTPSHRRQVFRNLLSPKEDDAFDELESDLRESRHVEYLRDTEPVQFKKTVGRLLRAGSFPRNPSTRIAKCRMELIDNFAEGGLSGRQARWFFRKHMAELLRKERHPGADGQVFDLKLAQRWVLWRVQELGWTSELFGYFDTMINRIHNRGRSAHKPERIGKKYQWLAWHEFLARLSDNFWYRDSDAPYSGRSDRGFRGAWQLHVRDIDPTCLFARTASEGDGDEEQHTERAWWSAGECDWRRDQGDREWTEDRDDLPPIEPLLVVSPPHEKSDWVQLGGYHVWEEFQEDEEAEEPSPQRSIRYNVRAMLVRADDVDRYCRWALERTPGSGFDFPRSADLYPYYTFLGECYWAPAYRDHETPYYHLEEWAPHDPWAADGADDTIPVLNPVMNYSAESSSLDCSIESGFTITLLVRWVAQAMQLSLGSDGRFFDAKGSVIAFDPSVDEPGPQTLLVRKEALLRFLKENGYGLVWTIWGEKMAFASDTHESSGRLNIIGAFRLEGGAPSGEVRFIYEDH